jgi:hypothetical protein
MMIRTGIFLVWCSCALTRAKADEFLEALANRDFQTISGQNFQAIQAASRELERNNLHIADYQITVLQSKESVFVLFGPPDPHERGNGFSVQLRRSDLAVISSQFDR